MLALVGRSSAAVPVTDSRESFVSGGRQIAVDRYASAGGSDQPTLLVLNGAGGE